MRLTIVPSDNVVFVDGLLKRVECAGFSELAGLHAVQWNGTAGHIEFDNKDATPWTFKPNEPLDDVARFQPVVDAWYATEIPPPPEPPVSPPFVDPNLRLDAGISAALGAAEEVRNSLHAITGGFTPANFAAFLVQAKILSDAFVAMLEAQRDQPPTPPTPRGT